MTPPRVISVISGGGSHEMGGGGGSFERVQLDFDLMVYNHWILPGVQ